MTEAVAECDRDNSSHCVEVTMSTDRPVNVPSDDAPEQVGNDTEGHMARGKGADAEAPEGDDVEGHVYVQEPGAPGTRPHG